MKLIDFILAHYKEKMFDNDMLPITLRERGWMCGSYFEFMYKHKESFYGHDEMGDPIRSRLDKDLEWDVFTPLKQEKKKIRRWQWRYKKSAGFYGSSDSWYSEEEISKLDGDVHRTKLLYTEIEDEE